MNILNVILQILIKPACAYLPSNTINDYKSYNEVNFWITLKIVSAAFIIIVFTKII